MVAFCTVMVEAVFSNQQRPRFNPRPVYVEFVVDGVALGQIFLWVRQSSRQCRFIDSQYSFIHLSTTFHDLCIPDLVSFIYLFE